MIKRPLIRAFFMGAVLFVVLKGLGACRAALLLFFRRRTHPGFNSGATPSMATLVTATAQHSSSIYRVCMTAISKRKHFYLLSVITASSLCLCFYFLCLTDQQHQCSTSSSLVTRQASHGWRAPELRQEASLREKRHERAAPCTDIAFSS